MNTTNAPQENTVKKGYWVAAYRSISDESALKAYRPLAVAAIQSFGGRFLTSPTSQIQVHEAGLLMRTTLVEFESYATALAAYESEAYQNALKVLGTATERDHRIVEGA